MNVSFTEIEVPCGFTVRQVQPGYKLSNGIILLHTEQDAKGCYYGAIGLDGIYLRTGKRYRPIFNESQSVAAFQEVKS